MNAKKTLPDLNRRNLVPKPRHQGAVIFDVMYGFIPVTEWEEAIINSPFFQRLRWIKQLGFSNYIFPGAEHNRFAHVIGVMHSMDEMIRSLGINASDEELYSKKSLSPEAILHKSLRVSALLHDIGTFPFSHAIEYAYLRHGNPQSSSRQMKSLHNNHEHLGAFIIKNTDYPGGLTRILNDAGLDVQLISNIIKGDSPYLIANQLMHSDLDADRMDYLLRDAHYTGIQYGKFDREYLMANLTPYYTKNGELNFGISDKAQHALEDFLIARFSWYSQVIKNPASAKFDIMASHLTQSLLEQNHLYHFPDLLTMIEKRDERFFWWNDLYFMQVLQQMRFTNALKNPKDTQLCEMLLYRKAPKTIRHPLFQHRILRDDGTSKAKELKKMKALVEEMQHLVQKKSKGTAWILADFPHKDVIFTKLNESKDSLKIVDHTGKAVRLVEQENSLMKHLAGFMNFVPSVYGNEEAVNLLKMAGMV